MYTPAPCFHTHFSVAHVQHDHLCILIDNVGQMIRGYFQIYIEVFHNMVFQNNC